MGCLCDGAVVSIPFVFSRFFMIGSFVRRWAVDAIDKTRRENHSARHEDNIRLGRVYGAGRSLSIERLGTLARRPVVANTADIVNAYVVNPMGRLLDNTGGRYRETDTLLDHSFGEMFSEGGFNRTAYERRY